MYQFDERAFVLNAYNIAGLKIITIRMHTRSKTLYYNKCITLGLFLTLAPLCFVFDLKNIVVLLSQLNIRLRCKVRISKSPRDQASASCRLICFSVIAS